MTFLSGGTISEAGNEGVSHCNKAVFCSAGGFDNCRISFGKLYRAGGQSNIFFRILEAHSGDFVCRGGRGRLFDLGHRDRFDGCCFLRLRRGLRHAAVLPRGGRFLLPPSRASRGDSDLREEQSCIRRLRPTARGAEPNISSRPEDTGLSLSCSFIYENPFFVPVNIVISKREAIVQELRLRLPKDHIPPFQRRKNFFEPSRGCKARKLFCIVSVGEEHHLRIGRAFFNENIA